jgi:hypothetical protein
VQYNSENIIGEALRAIIREKLKLVVSLKEFTESRHNVSYLLREVRAAIRELNRIDGKFYRYDYRLHELYISQKREESRYC